MVAAFAEWVIRWRWMVMGACLGMTVLAGVGIQRIHIAGDYRIFFSAENPQLQAFDHLQNVYSKNDNVMFVVVPSNGQVFTRDTLAAVAWLTEQGWQLPYSRRVDSLTNFQHTRSTEDELQVGDLVPEPAQLTNSTLQELRDIALSEPLLVGQLISRQAHVTAVNVTVTRPGKSPTEMNQIIAAARTLATQTEERWPHLRIMLNGMVVYDHAFAEYAQHDMQTLIPLMLAVIIVVTLLLLRSVTATLVTVLVIALSVVTAVGLMGWFGIQLSAPTASAPTVIMTLAIADSVHLLASLFHYMRQGQTRQQAIVSSVRLNWTAVFLTSLTTVVGFASMNFSEVPPFRDLGNIVAIGVAAAWLYAVFFLPAFLATVPLRALPKQQGEERVMIWLSNIVVQRSRILLGIMGLITLAAVVLIPRNELNDNFAHYFDHTVPFRQAADFVAANLSGVERIEYSIPAAGSGGVADPEYLLALERFAAWWRAQPGVAHVNSFSEIMKRLNKNMHADNPDFYRVPESRELAAQYLLLYEMSLPQGLDLTDQVNVAKSSTRFVVTITTASSKQLMALDRAAQDWLAQHAPSYMRTMGTGTSMMFAHIGQRNIQSMIGGNVMSLVLVSLIMIFAVRSLKIGLLSLVPNLVPVVLAFGLWGLLVGQVGLSLSVVTTLTFGIVVDDTIHFLTKYLHGRRELNLTPHEAVRYAFTTVGSAMWITSVILIAGFLVLTFSAFELNAGMGLLAALTIGLALLADYLLLPPLLLALERKRHDTPARPL